MRSLTEESSELPFTSSGVSGGTKAREGLSGSNKSIVSIESITGASRILAILEHLIVKGFTDDTSDAAAASTGGCRRSGAATLALAIVFTILVGVAAPSKLAAAEAIGAESAIGLPPTLLCCASQNEGKG